MGIEHFTIFDADGSLSGPLERYRAGDERKVEAAEQRSHWGSKNCWVSQIPDFFFGSPIYIQSYILEYCDRADFICAIFAWQIEYVDHWPEHLGAAHATGPSGWASRVWGKQRVTEMSDVGS